MLKIALAFLVLLTATAAEARYYDPARDGDCYTLDQMRKKVHASYLKFYPKRGGGRCWYRPGRPEVHVAKKEVVQYAQQRPQRADARATDKIEAVAITLPAAVSLHEFVAKLEREPATFAQRFDASYARWYDLVSPYVSARDRRTTVASVQGRQ